MARAPSCTAWRWGLRQAPNGSVAYVGLWHGPVAVAGSSPAGSGAVVALAVETGAMIGQGRLAGVPEQLVVAAAPGRVGERLYCVEGSPGPEVRNPGSVGEPAPTWRLLALDPVTLHVEATYPLSDNPLSLAVAPDGDRAYALTHHSGRQSAIIEIDLMSGASRSLALLPGLSLGNLVVTEERVYAPHTTGHDVWAVDRRQGRLAATIQVGRHPTHLVMGIVGTRDRPGSPPPNNDGSARV